MQNFPVRAFRGKSLNVLKTFRPKGAPERGNTLALTRLPLSGFYFLLPFQMARPLKNNADWFKHDKGMRNDPKIRALRKEHGLAGYAVYCMMLEVLTDSHDFSIEADELNCELLAADFGIDIAVYNSILNSFSRLKLFQNPDGILRCEKLMERMAGLVANRQKKRDYAASKQKAETPVNTEKGGVLAVYNSTVEKSRGEESREEKNITTTNSGPSGSANMDVVMPSTPGAVIKAVEALAEDALKDTIHFVPSALKRYGEQHSVSFADLARVRDKMPALMSDFVQHIKGEGIHSKDVQGFRAHFKNWMCKKRPPDILNSSGSAMVHYRDTSNAGTGSMPADQWNRLHHNNPNSTLKRISS